MEKKETRARFFELKNEMAQLLNGAKAENRALTEDENAKMTQYRQELTEIQVEMQIEAASRMAEASCSQSAEFNTRELALRFAEKMVAAASGTPLQVANHRSYAGDARTDVAGATPLTIGDVIEPLEKGNIMGLLGCKIQSGLFGDWKYPVVSAVEAEVAGETAEISDTKITMDAVKPVPQRVGLSILVTRSALNATNDELRSIVLNQIVLGLDRLLNKWMFKRSAIATNVNGLFVEPGTEATMAGATPTYAEILALKGAVDAEGVKPDATAAYVMTNAMKATLEATPKSSGNDHFIIEDGKINGVPVYVTEYAPEGAVEFGYFSYALVGQFGNTEILVDPFTKATANSVRFILNTDFDIKAARAEAFGILEPASSGSGVGA